jgi:SAM-dependent methyltransferase
VSWLEYWNQETSLYVNERHRHLHYDLVTRDVLAHLPARKHRVVDYGCGDTPTAARLAAACDHLLLCDAAPRVRAHLRARYAGQANITVITPQQFDALEAHSIAMIIVNSVVQYLSKPQFNDLIEQARQKLAPGGVLLLADIVPRRVGFLRDTLELIKFAAGNGFLLPVLFGLARSYFSPYRKIRQSFGFLQFEEAEILQLLREKGFKARRQGRNIGHNAARMTFLGVAP